MTIASDYHALITERLRPQDVNIAGFERGSVCVRLLTDEDVSDAKIDAYKFMDDQCKAKGVRLLDLMEADPEPFERERQRQQIHRAFIDALTIDEEFDDYRPALDLTRLRRMDSVMLDDLFDIYERYQAIRTIRVDVSEDEVATYAAALREPGNDAALSVLDDAALRALCMGMAKAMG